MNVLVLYGFRNLSLARNTSLNHLYCFQRYAPQHNYLYHCGHQPVTKAMQDIEFSAVILDTSFFSQRTSRPRGIFDEFRDRWSWLAEIEAVKIGLPQDDYDHCHLLDDWLCDLKMDVIYSAVTRLRHVLYPESSKIAEFVDCLTGYIDDTEVLKFQKHSKPLRERRIDFGYRGRELEPYYGRLGQLKGEIHRRFSVALSKTDFVVDSAIAKDTAILGEDWVRFLCDTRFTCAGTSGLSLADPYGDIRERTVAYLQEKPDASFNEVEAACFAGLDDKHRFTTTPPRMFEAAAAGVCQILIEGDYLLDLKPDVHYIPLRSDFSNLNAAIAKMRDLDSAQQIADNCFEALIATDKYRYNRFGRDVVTHVEDLAQARGLSLHSDPRFAEKIRFHERELAGAEASVSATTSADRKLDEPGGSTSMRQPLLPVRAFCAAIRFVALIARAIVPQPLHGVLRRFRRRYLA